MLITLEHPRPKLILVLVLWLSVGASSCLPSNAASPPGVKNSGMNGFPGQDKAATQHYLSTLDFTQTDSIIDAWVPCHNSSDCAGDSVHIRVVPEKKAYHVPVDAALHAGHGYIVARIVNLSNAAYDSYKLAALDTAYLWVGAMPSGVRRMGIFRISAVTGAATGLATATKAGWCSVSPGVMRTVSAVHLNPMPNCTSQMFYTSIRDIGSIDIRLANSGSLLMPEVAAKLMAHNRGLWFSCSMGCCEASGFAAGT